MKYAHDTTLRLYPNEALLLAQDLINGAMKGEAVRLNLYLKYPQTEGNQPKFIVNSDTLSLEVGAVWAIVDGHEIYDNGTEG